MTIAFASTLSDPAVFGDPAAVCGAECPLREPIEPSMPSHHPTTFAGRRAELGALGGMVDLVGEHGARVVVVEGPAGIGKSEVVRQFVKRCRGPRVFWADGDRTGPVGSFAMISQLLGPIGVRVSRARAAEMLAIERPVEVGRVIVQAMSGLGHQDPVVLVVDDAHRADVDSLRALLFALRRLTAHPVLTILTRRSEVDDLPEGLVRLAACDRTGSILSLGPLRPVDVQELAQGICGPGLTLRAACRLCVHAQGNPGNVIALLAESPVEVWGRDSVLPAPHVFSRAIDRRLATCTDEARRLIEAVSVLGDPADLWTAGALAEVGEPLGALEEACFAGLLATPMPGSVSCVRFPDSLVRAAVHGQLTHAQRVQLQLAAAGLVDDEEAAAQHRGRGLGRAEQRRGECHRADGCAACRSGAPTDGVRCV